MRGQKCLWKHCFFNLLISSVSIPGNCRRVSLAKLELHFPESTFTSCDQFKLRHGRQKAEGSWCCCGEGRCCSSCLLALTTRLSGWRVAAARPSAPPDLAASPAPGSPTPGSGVCLAPWQRDTSFSCRKHYQNWKLGGVKESGMWVLVCSCFQFVWFSPLHDRLLFPTTCLWTSGFSTRLRN